MHCDFAYQIGKTVYKSKNKKKNMCLNKKEKKVD